MKKFLVLQLARFGDIIQSKRLVLSLMAQGQVHLCVDASLANLARMIYPQISLWAVEAHGQRDQGQILASLIQLGAQLQAENYDEIYNLNQAGLNLALTSTFPAEKVRGPRLENGQFHRSPWQNMAVRWMSKRRDFAINLVDFWGLMAAYPVPGTLVNPPALPGGKGLGLVLAGQNARRSLPPEVMAKLVRSRFETLKHQAGAKIYLLGGPGEKSLGRTLLGQLGALGDKAENLAGRTNWQDLQTVLCGLDVLLSPDTGTVHLAAHLGVPVEGLYCSSAWALETGPYGLGHKVWQAVPPCAPCPESRPCPHVEPPCRQAFARPDLLLRLAGRDVKQSAEQVQNKYGAKAEEALALLHSDFDALGQCWHGEALQAGTFNGFEQKALRALLTEYFGTGAAPAQSGAQALATQMYQEQDWMLPPRVDAQHNFHLLGADHGAKP